MIRRPRRSPLFPYTTLFRSLKSVGARRALGGGSFLSPIRQASRNCSEHWGQVATQKATMEPLCRPPADTFARATAWLAQPITADHVKQAASPTRQEHHAQGLKHLSSDRLPQRRMLALRFHRGQLRISLDRSPLAHELWGREKKQFAPRKFLDFFVAPSPRISGFPKHKGSTVAAKVKSGTRAAQDRPDGPGVGSGRVPGRPRASPREELRA